MKSIALFSILVLCITDVTCSFAAIDIYSPSSNSRITTATTICHGDENPYGGYSISFEEKCPIPQSCVRFYLIQGLFNNIQFQDLPTTQALRILTTGMTPSPQPAFDMQSVARILFHQSKMAVHNAPDGNIVGIMWLSGTNLYFVGMGGTLLESGFLGQDYFDARSAQMLKNISEHIAKTPKTSFRQYSIH
jgi:hypothetical protein